MKILITTEFYLPLRCGVTIAVINLKKALERIGHEVRILTIGSNKNSYYEDGVYYVKSNLPQFYKDSYATTSFGGEMFDDIISWHPDVVHSQCEFFTMVYAKKVAKKLGIPIIHTCHTDFDSYQVHFTKNTKLWRHLTHTWIPRILRKVKYIVCPTTKVYDLLKGYGVENPMSIIPVGLDLEHLAQVPSHEEWLELRHTYDISEKDIVLVSVCRLSEEKNVKESIEHFNSLLKIRKDIKLLIVGDGTTKTALEEQVKDLGIVDWVKFTGSVPMEEVWKYYHLGDIFVSSSLSEIQGLTYIEALSASLPIVCRADASLRESLLYGINGYDFNTDAEFLERIMPLLDDAELRKKMGKQAFESVEKYSLKHYGDSVMEIYEDFI